MEAKHKKQSSIVVYLKNLSKKDKIILSSTIIFVSLALGLRFVIFPQLEQYKNNLMALDNKRTERSKLSMIPIENKALEEKQQELKEQYEVALGEIPKTPAVAKIIYDLRGLMTRSNVEVKSLSFSDSDVSEDEMSSSDDVKTDENGVVTEIERGISGGEMPDQKIGSEESVKKQIVNISLVGKYENIIDFIKSIEYYSRIADVSNISLSPGEGDLLNASLTANFYNLNSEEEESYDFNNGTYGKENSFN